MDELEESEITLTSETESFSFIVVLSYRHNSSDTEVEKQKTMDWHVCILPPQRNKLFFVLTQPIKLNSTTEIASENKPVTKIARESDNDLYQ